VYEFSSLILKVFIISIRQEIHAQNHTFNSPVGEVNTLWKVTKEAEF
jgi:hypothetical protein